PLPFSHLPAPVVPSLPIDMGLIALFGIQHSVMARPRWKRWWTSIVSPVLERSLYVSLASCSLLLLFWFWQPIPAVIWQVEYPSLRAVISGICLAGWAIVVLATFQFDHFELLGLRQVWNSTHNQPPTSPVFRRPLMYRFVRHPMMSGFLVAFWATPLMRVD